MQFAPLFGIMLLSLYVIVPVLYVRHRVRGLEACDDILEELRKIPENTSEEEQK